MEKISVCIEFLRKGAHEGVLVSYKDWLSDQEGYSSPFIIKYDEKDACFKITFPSREVSEKHASFLEKEKTCFMAIIAYDQYNQSMTLGRQEIKLGIVCKFKKFTEEKMVIEITNFNTEAIPPEVSKRK